MISFEYVIRTVGERTEEVCIELVQLQKNLNEKATVIREPTHASAVDKTFMLGLQSEADWFVLIDADMLLLPGCMQEIKNEIQSLSKNTFVIFPAVYDKLYSMRRWGVTVYRVSVIEEVYKAFQKVRRHHHLKIEGKAIKEVASRQKEMYFSRKVVALHDFHQYYKDLYRKTYLNAIRNPGYNKRAKKYWKKMSAQDADYLVMLKGLEDALTEGRQLTNSVNDFSQAELTERIREQRLSEKHPLYWKDFANNSFTMSMEAEISSNEKNSVFNDYFENNSTIDKCKSLILRCLPGPVHEGYLSVKSNVSKYLKQG